MEPINIWVYDRLHKKRRRVTLRVSSSKRDRRKTEISTFVNFIHQKDASIAMSVIEDMFTQNAPIYTVHDNFLTTGQYSENISTYYSKAIHKMGPPLLIINEFIYMNVIKPILKRADEGHQANIPKEGFIRYMPIPKEILLYYLNANVPENITKRMKATWEERNSRILTSYDNYKRHVCGHLKSSNPMDYWEAHEKKWENFQFMLKNMGANPYYCVHH